MTTFETKNQGQSFHGDDGPHTEQVVAPPPPSLALYSLPYDPLQQGTIVFYIKLHIFKGDHQS
jgi:hypothetical protein